MRYIITGIMATLVIAFILPSIALAGGSTEDGKLLATESIDNQVEAFKELNKKGIKALVENIDDNNLAQLVEKLTDDEKPKLLAQLSEERFLKLLESQSDDKLEVMMKHLPNKGDKWIKNLKDDEVRTRLLPLARNNQLRPLLGTMKDAALGEFLAGSDNEGLNTRIVIILRSCKSGIKYSMDDDKPKKRKRRRARKSKAKAKDVVISKSASTKEDCPNKGSCSTPQITATQTRQVIK